MPAQRRAAARHVRKQRGRGPRRRPPLAAPLEPAASRRPPPARRAGRAGGAATRSSPGAASPAQEGRRAAAASRPRSRARRAARRPRRATRRARAVRRPQPTRTARAGDGRPCRREAGGRSPGRRGAARRRRRAPARAGRAPRPRARRGARRGAAAARASRAGRGSPRRRRRAHAARVTRSASSSASRRVPVPVGGSSRRRLQRVEQRAAALPRPLDDRLVPERDRAEPVAAARRGVADRDRDAFGDVGLAALAGAERHRRRRVEHEPRDEHALCELDAHVRLAGARRHVPLDAPDVVARLVGPHLPELAADARERGAVVAREQAVDAATDRQLERAQRGRRERPRAGLLGVRIGASGSAVGRAHAACVRPRSICGIGTAASTWSRIASGATSSASAR